MARSSFLGTGVQIAHWKPRSLSATSGITSRRGGGRGGSSSCSSASLGGSRRPRGGSWTGTSAGTSTGASGASNASPGSTDSDSQRLSEQLGDSIGSSSTHAGSSGVFGIASTSANGDAGVPEQSTPA